MRFLKSNTFKIIVACFVIFMAIPFIFVESSEVKKGDTPSIPLEQTSNPLVRFFDRIGSFYGFKKSPKDNKDRAKRPSFDKKGEGVNLASAKRPGNLLPPGRNSFDKEDGKPLRATDAKTGIVPSGSYNKKARLPEIKEYVRMDGETYEVIKDHEGRKFVAMPDGFVPYEKLMADTVSQEEFQAAKAKAPQLEDWEIFEALRSPGGLPAYLASGGKNAYPDARRSDKSGRNSGGRVSGRRISGDKDDIYDERKFAASIRENSRTLEEGSTAGRIITSSIKSKYNEARREEAAKNNSAEASAAGELADLIATDVVLGDNQVAVKTKTDSNKKSAFIKSKGGKLNTTIQPADRSVTERMLNSMGIKDFSKPGKDNMPLDNVFIYPKNEIEVNTEPGLAFVSVNEDIITENKDALRDQFKKSDTVYNNNKAQIEALKQSIPGFRVAVVDGIEDGKVKSVNPDTFHYKLIENFMGSKIPAAKYINIRPEEKSNTLLVVPDENSLNNLRRAGYNAVLFEKYAITPNDMTEFYNNSLSTVKYMSNAKIAAQKTKKNQPDFVKDIVSSRVGVSGI